MYFRHLISRYLYQAALIGVLTAHAANHIGFQPLAHGQLPETIVPAELQAVTQGYIQEGFPQAQAYTQAAAVLMLPGAPIDYQILVQHYAQEEPLQDAVYFAMRDYFMINAHPLPAQTTPAAFRRVWQYASNIYTPLPLWTTFQIMLENPNNTPFQAMIRTLMDRADNLLADVNQDLDEFVANATLLLPELPGDIWNNTLNHIANGWAANHAFVAALIEAQLAPAIPAEEEDDDDDDYEHTTEEET